MFKTLFSSKKLYSLLAILIVTTSLITNLIPAKALAATTTYIPPAKVSFTFDDALSSAYSQAAPTLAKYGLKATEYVPTGCVGTTGSCPENPDASYMSWTQIVALQNTYGWEVGSHTANTPCLADNSPGCPNAALLTNAQINNELVSSKQALARHGINAQSFASPYGDYNNNVLAQIAKVYSSHRGFADQNINGWPYNDYLLNDMQVQEGVTVAQVETAIDAAITNHTWLVLTLHDIMVSPSTNPADYQYSTAELDQISSYVKSKQSAGLIQSANISDGLVNSKTNLLTNSSFAGGISGGWTTDSPSYITRDSANNGSYPNATYSVKLTSGGANAHLFSPKVAVGFGTTYALKSFLNVQTIISGSVGYYIDEYDANGNWSSGQYKKSESSAFVEDMNFMYSPSSAAVTKASLQVIVTGNSGISAYFANPQWFPVQSTAATTPTNLVSNGTFDNGISAGWTTDDPANIVADSHNNGSPANPVNSVFMTAKSTAQNNHLFSPKVTIDPTKTYFLSSYLNIKTRNSGEVGYYIDEYDLSGNWISGQYKKGVTNPGIATVSFNYAPSSASVKSASLQIIVVGNSGITAYVDNVIWPMN